MADDTRRGFCNSPQRGRESDKLSPAPAWDVELRRGRANFSRFIGDRDPVSVPHARTMTGTGTVTGTGVSAPWDSEVESELRGNKQLKGLLA
jgi:hypothetical protein